jgi:hypothetical protein
MGFFSNLLTGDFPHKKFARDGKDYCVDTSISSVEQRFLSCYSIASDNFVPARIGLRVNMFNFFLTAFDKQNPELAAAAAQCVFVEVIQAHYSTLSEPLKTKVSKYYPGSIYSSISSVILKFVADLTGKDMESLPADLKKELVNYGGTCAEEISNFFQKNSRKLA